MARNLNMAFFVAMAAAAMVMNSAVAATTHQVGDATGWTIPSGGAAFYTTWASNKTFAVGDTLVFPFTSNAHDVAEVTKAAFDSCSATSPISLQTGGPASIVLGSAGEKYYICTFPSHCTAGQKLTITATGASSPAPAPSATTPPPSPTPSPPASVPAPAPSTTTPTPASAPTPSSSAPTPSSSPPTPPSSAPTPSSSPPTPPSSAPTPSSAATPPGATPPPGTADSPPAAPPSAAVSLGGAGLAGTFLSIALVLLY